MSNDAPARAFAVVAYIRQLLQEARFAARELRALAPSEHS
jgi:hypothetical protein